MTGRASNRGPAAAAENRQALLSAAGRLFAERGFSVPLSVIAKEAGVGQGVLYRHFPQRLDLARAVFATNFVELEALAASESPDAFERLFARVVELMLESLGFVEMAIGMRGTRPDDLGEQRLRRLVGPSLARARAAGAIAENVTGDDVELGIQMIYGAAITSTSANARRDAVRRAKAIVVAAWRTGGAEAACGRQPRPGVSPGGLG